MSEQRDLHQRFWVFYSPTYYPAGGLGDVEYTCDTLQQACDWLNEHKHLYHDEISIFDAHLREQVPMREDNLPCAAQNAEPT